MNSEGIAHLLGPIDLMQYEDNFKTKGYDIESDFFTLNEQDLDHMKIVNEEHRKVILDAARTFETSEYYKVFLWLRDNGLDYYFINFVNCDIDSLKAASDIEVNEQIFHDLELHLPSHRKRLTLAVQKLRKRQRIQCAPENIIAVGYWGRPQALEGANYDFLCIQATVKSRDPNDSTFCEEFMVDSGSDVVTIKQELLDRLNLEHIGTIQSRGVHSTVEKQLYKAFLVFGTDTEIEVEVMSESYNSIGNRIMRQFRHVIDNHRHFWLPLDPNLSSESENSGSISDNHQEAGGEATICGTTDTNEEDRSPSTTSLEHSTSVTKEQAPSALEHIPQENIGTFPATKKPNTNIPAS